MAPATSQPAGAWVSAATVSQIVRPRRPESRKGENGAVLVVGGSAIYHGAPLLTALGAQRCGVDLVYLAVPRLQSTPLRAFSPTLIVFPLPDAKLTRGSVARLVKWSPRVDAVAIGPGLGRQPMEAAKQLIREMSNRGARLLLDAEALQADVVAAGVRGSTVLTPHAGEFQRVFGIQAPTDLEQRAALVREKAAASGLTVLLKGAVDIISDGEAVALNRTGSPAMTVGGTGDVLSGLVAGLLAQGMRPFDAAVYGAYANGLAGERAFRRLGLHITATDVVEEIPRVMKRFDKIA